MTHSHRDGDGASVDEIEEIYRAQLGRLRRVARAIVGDEEAARDVVQEAFASAVRGRARFRGDGSASAWLWQMVVNAAIGEQRRRGRQATEALPLEQAERDAGEDGSERAARLAVALPLLPERQRLVVFLHYYAELDYRGIGEVLGISPGTVGATLHAARRTLLRELDAEEVRR